jgi:hypothetical protein
MAFKGNSGGGSNRPRRGGVSMSAVRGGLILVGLVRRATCFTACCCTARRMLHAPLSLAWRAHRAANVVSPATP